jgi:predicted enzyme related to lactoylglutathione lyase
MNLSAVRVFVRDLAGAQSFYSRDLGFSLRGGGDEFGYCVFDAGQAQLIVESVPNDAPEEDQILVGRFTGVSFAVSDVEATHKELIARGVHFTGAPELQSWGGVLATFSDPEGNQLQIVQVKRAV